MQIVDTTMAMQIFALSETTVLQLFKRKGSPAFKAGKNWRVDAEEFKQFLIKVSEEHKS